MYSYFDYTCEHETVFRLEAVRLKEVDVKSFYCDFSKKKTLSAFYNPQLKPGMYISYDTITKKIIPLSSQEKAEYLARLKTDLDNIKNDSDTKSKMFEAYTVWYRDYENSYSQMFKKYVFSKKEQVQIALEIEKQPFRIFQKTIWERLLMNGRVISREEWGADENYSKKEVYLPGCPSWNCWSGTTTVKFNQTRENYIENFSENDAKNKQVITYDDGRDAHLYYPVERIIIHHTAGGYKDTKEEWLAYMKAVHKYHALSLWWSDIWYHYLIDGAWNIYEWRAGWKSVLWAHVASHNYGSVWIALMSDGEYSQAMLDALQDLIVYLWKEYNLNLSEQQSVRNKDLTQYETGWVVVAHKELDYGKPHDPDIDMTAFRKQIVSRIQLEKTLTQSQ